MSDVFLSSKVIVAVVFILLWAMESVAPNVSGHSHRLRHATRNLTLTGINMLVTLSLSALLLVQVASWAEAAHFGLLRLAPLPWLPATILALFLLDAWMYVWHRANHELPFLWCFHRVHHSDPAMDVTSALRFHTGEILISGLLRTAVIALLGVSVRQVLLYEALMLPIIFFHHSNIKIPDWIDRGLRSLITTPALHRVHHSRLMDEANSNYGTIFSFWDRLAKTFRLRRDGSQVEYGVQGFEGDQWQSVRGLLLTPFSVDEYFTPAYQKTLSGDAKRLGAQASHLLRPSE